MKGTLHKIDNIWMVKYGDMQFLPLHIDEIIIEDNRLEGEIIEFEIITKLVWDSLKQRSIDVPYSFKLIDHIVDTNEMVLDDCEEVKNWDNFVEQKNLELLAEEVYGKGVNQDYEEGFVDGYNKAKESLYTKEQLMEVIELARLIDYNGSNDYYMSEDEIINALKP